MRCARIRFAKTGRMIYISHLDVMRLMTRAVRRAEIPMWFTEGFNPHPYIAFALPLSLGQSSECEYMDIKIESDMTNEELHEKLADIMPDGFKIISVTDPVHDPKKINSALYSVKLVFETESEASEFCLKAHELMAGEELMAEKMGKKGHRKVLKQVNLIEQIFEAKTESENCNVIMTLKLAAGNTVNLNPSLLIETIEKMTDIHSSLQYIERKDLITESGESFC